MYPIIPPRLFESTYQDEFVSPIRETPITTIRRGEFAIRYLYSRSSESQSANVIGQDALRFRYNDNKIVFAVCDGVGQSFNGQLASQFLGDDLVKWLWDLPEEMFLDVKAFPIKIRAHLNELIEKATNVVEKFSIPRNMPQVVINVLEEMRSMGSETTFVCGCIFLPNKKLPNGRITVSWLGDTEFRLWDKSGQLIDLKTEFISGEHWSTRKGLQSKKPHTLTIHDLKDIGRLAVFSDGLLPIQYLIEEVVDDEIINDSAQAISNSGDGDDLSYWEINIEHQGVQIQDIIETRYQRLEQPTFNHVDIIPNGLLIRWLGSNIPSDYIIRYEVNGIEKESGKPVYGTEYKIQNTKWKTIKFGVQSKVGKDLSEISHIEFSRKNNYKGKLLIATLIMTGTAIFAYLLGLGK